MQEKRKINYMNLLLILVFVVGLGILLYPNISDYFNRKNSSKSITEYDEEVAKLTEEERKAMMESATAYNEELLENPVGRFAEMSESTLAEYMATLDIDGKGMMGYIKIEKLGVNIPIYHTTNEDVLQHYVGHIEGTSLPVGGVGTHCGLSGHRGLPSAVLFTNLDRMEVGDVFSLIVLGEEHFYQVDQIETVLPNDMSLLAIDPDKDYCTLVTCTPYGENTHRLMVRGVRIPGEDAAEAIKDSDKSKQGLTREQIVNIIAAGMAAVFAFVVLPLLLFPAKPKKVVYLRPWDDNIEKVMQSAIALSEDATRANWQMDEITVEADRLAKMRRWDDTLNDPKPQGSEDEERPWNEYRYVGDDSPEMSKEEEKKYREWDDEVLEKVDQDWEPLDRKAYRNAIRYTDIREIFQRGTVEAPKEDMTPYFKKEKEWGEIIRKKSKKDK